MNETQPILVPNRFPIYNIPRRLAIIGEAPGMHETYWTKCPLGHEYSRVFKHKIARREVATDHCPVCKSTAQIPAPRPFVGPSGTFLANLLRRPRSSCDINTAFLGNICQVRPPGNDITKFTWDSPYIQSGLAQLKKDIATFQPAAILLLGNVALKAAKDCYRVSPLKGNALRHKIKDWHGSVFMADQLGIFSGAKCIPSYHPANCLRTYENTPLLELDIAKAVRQSSFRDVRRRPRMLDSLLTFEQTEARLKRILDSNLPVGTDIEGYIDAVSCISFAETWERGFIVPFFRKDGSPVFPPTQEATLFRLVAQVLEAPHVPKVLQNALYDCFVLSWTFGITIWPVADDIMLKAWEVYAELPKGLGAQIAVHLEDEEFYKGERDSQNDDNFYKYCIKDSVHTIELSQKYDTYKSQFWSRKHYAMNVELLQPLLYMERTGILYDPERAKQRRDELLHKMYEAQARLNWITGWCLAWKTHAERQAAIRQTMMTVDGARPYKKFEDAYARVSELLDYPNPDLATIGEVEDCLNISLNVNSPKFTKFLYEDLSLPKQYNDDKEKPALSADYEALITLVRLVTLDEWRFGAAKRRPTKGERETVLQILRLAIELRALQTRAGMLGISTDNDGRVRCGYNVVGSDTGRIQCYTSPTGSGYNIQTIPNYTNVNEAPGGILGDRDLFISDESYWFFQCDLKGADGWTVAAYCAMLGDPTMLLDYAAGLSPFTILTLKLRGVDVNFDDRQALAQASKTIEKEAWDRFAMKRVQHGGCYMEGDITVSRNIFKDSEGKLYMPPHECGAIKNFMFTRYWGIKAWHKWVAQRMREMPQLTAASGQIRQFFGRPDEILTKAVAFEPQANTTWVTNLAMLRLWKDQENRYHDQRNQLRIMPLHQVHDALCGQFLKSDTAWAIGKIQSYFNNKVTIAGQQLVIPYDGAYGVSWGDLKAGKL